MSTPTMPKSKKGGKKSGLAMCHSMKSKFDRTSQEKGNRVENSINEKWNLEVKVAKMIKKGYARGFFFRKDGSGAGRSKDSDNAADGLDEVDQFLEVELTKILETGIALGFNFHAVGSCLACLSCFGAVWWGFVGYGAGFASRWLAALCLSFSMAVLVGSFGWFLVMMSFAPRPCLLSSINGCGDGAAAGISRIDNSG
ncbi:hypothetical protein LWI28_010133 [Acer negundo]|uniref:Uncharacterized protein n=1 Tax=Acer negundo TaxID=4023 RepID=A0AAD5J4G4_ACENE|nr:hypothetical protein LWI28_010133 [Acer negundo]